ncbi:unnamed protein product [Effrenium voratum]|nr:unnamed protein product [Effrenium voratum]
MSVDASVLAAFKKFDKDKTGSISREELAAVLQTLDPVEWDNDAIDHLLTQADSSGDGELQIQEFVSWVFAENYKSVGVGPHAGTGDNCLVISGCSRDELNGVYVQMRDKHYCHRPVFLFAAKNRFLFYQSKRQQWQVHHECSMKASCRLQTKRAPHLGGTWSVWKQTGDASSFVEEPEMGCALQQLSAEEQISKAAKAIVVREPSSVKGCFLRQEELVNGRPLYFKDKWGGQCIVYFAEEEIWGLVSGKPGACGDLKFAMSDTTQGYSPDLVSWKLRDDDDIDLVAADPSTGAASLNVPEGWKDPEMPHTLESIGKGKEVQWMRALAMTPCPVLFGDDCRPQDACQGKMGDCWLVAAIASMMEFPGYIQEKIFLTKELALDGKYEITLYDWKTDTWPVIQVDDYLPVGFRWDTWEPPRPQFASIPDGKLYVALLEKAFAKHRRGGACYQDLSTGDACEGIVAMTGCLERTWYHATDWKEHHPERPPKWVVTANEGVAVHAECPKTSEKLGQLSQGANFQEVARDGGRIQFKKISGDGPEEGWLSWYVAGQKVAKRCSELRWFKDVGKVSKEKQHLAEGLEYDERNVPVEDMWPILCELDQANFPLVTGVYYQEDEWNKKANNKQGLKTHHAYSLLGAKEVDGVKLVCIRNPWGGAKEWKGPWGDQQEEWTTHPKVSEELASFEELCRTIPNSLAVSRVLFSAWDGSYVSTMPHG